MDPLRAGAARKGVLPFEVCLDTGELFRDGHRIPLQDQPGRLLALLASRPGEIVGRAEIRDSLWHGVIVEFDHAVNTAIKKIRAALDDDPDKPRIIETVPKRGYRFIADVEGLEQPPMALPADVAPRATQERRLSLSAPPTAEPTSLAISPDGLKIAFAAIVDGRLHLRLRALDTGGERSLPGSDGGQSLLVSEQRLHRLLRRWRVEGVTRRRRHGPRDCRCAFRPRRHVEPG